MRVKSAKPMHNGGWLHLPDGKSPIPYLPPIKPSAVVKIDADAIVKKWQQETSLNAYRELGSLLGVDPMALKLLGAAWAQEHNAWAFPMKDENRNIIGIRLRNNEGQKWAVKGSKAGIFIPEGLPACDTVMVVEGPTDCSAALTIDFSAIGRPSCLGCEDMIDAYCRINKIKRVVIVSDNDGPGMSGADKLQSNLKVPSAIFIPPAKDLREFARLGGTRIIIESMIKNLVWSKK